MKKVKFIQQLSESGCGVAALCMILNFYGCKIHIAELNKKINVSRDGVSIKSLISLSNDFGLKSKAVQLKNKKSLICTKEIFPCICIKNNSHYIVLEKVKNNDVVYIDPELGRIRISVDEFNEFFNGIVIIFTPTKQFKKRKKGKNTINLLKLGFLDKKLVLILVCISLLIQILTLFTPWFTRYIIDDVIGNNLNKDINYLFICSIIFVLLYGVFSYVRALLISILQKKYIYSLKRKIVEKTFKLPLKFFDIRPSGEIISRINNIDLLQHSITNMIMAIFIDLLTIIISSLAMIKVSRELAIINFILGFILCIIVFVLLKIVDKKNIDSIASREKTQSYLMQIFSNVLLIKTSVGYQNSIKKWNEFYNRQISLEYNREKILGLYQSFMMSYRLLPTFIILLIGSFIINSGLMTTGEMMAFITLTNIFFNPLATIMQTIFDSQYTISIIDRLMEITLDDDEITDKGRNISEFEKLEFKNVSFSYNNNYENMVVDNISFKLKKGQSLSIIGKTGCGKTTIVKLLLSIYSQYKGNILLNNINIKNYNLDTYRKIFGVVLQDQMFFNDTIRNNLDISNEHTDEEIYLALKIACFDEEVQKMPFNIHTQIGDNGSNLSGGQRQRLAIARALLTKPKIIILDEGTNQLDAITENKIMKKFRDENISLILITHRLSSIIFSDEILLLDNGRIVDRGTHKELKDRSDFYCSLIDKQ